MLHILTGISTDFSVCDSVSKLFINELFARSAAILLPIKSGVVSAVV